MRNPQAVNQAKGDTVNLPRVRVGCGTRIHGRRAQLRRNRSGIASPPFREYILPL
ncbi:MAG: hypothetical protein JW730_03795 [Anaerolineales bacterium]|nr:hypothetical protein [Anaerolineales bacterium]